ncbi:MAG: histidine phosphatase family protein [Clostridia bacterium]|nr:histidine phosphatase family protein [Clostridia bacterium]
MKFVLIRHGLTQGNLERRYIGCRTDERLCPAGVKALEQRAYPQVSRVFVSPMKRCAETAAILYPHITPEAVNDFRECDFGDFENKSYEELNGTKAYQRWIDSGGELPFPGGESQGAFACRCADAFDKLADSLNEDCAFIVHGGTIMAIMSRRAFPPGSYFEFQVSNGEGFILEANGSYTRL